MTFINYYVIGTILLTNRIVFIHIVNGGGSMPTKLSNFFSVLGCLSTIIGVAIFIYLLINQSFLSGFIFLGVFLVIMIILILIVTQMEDKRKAQQKLLLSTLQPKVGNYHETKSYVAYDLLSKVALDEKNERIYFWVPENPEVQTIKDASYGMPYRIFDYPYSALLSAQIIEDSASISTLSRQSQSARILLNGLEQTNDIQPKKPSNDEHINSMELKLILKDQVRPIHVVRFYSDINIKLNKNSPEHRKVQGEIEQWFTILRFIIKETDQKEGYYHAHEDETKQPQIISESKFEKEVHVQYPIHDESKALVKAQLLSVLDKVIYKKIVEYSTRKKVVDSPQSNEKSSTYFDDLIEKNRKQLNGNQIEE